MKYLCLSEIGLVRETNQDRALVLEQNGVILSIVCDGIGGANGGDYASQRSVDHFAASFKEQAPSFTSMEMIIDWFGRELTILNQQLLSQSQRNARLTGMGTTAAVVVIFKNRAIGFNVGDSRIYDYRRNRLSVLSHDQTYAYMMYMNNEITIEDVAVHPKRNVLMNAVGATKDVSFETIRIPDGWSRLLVCSDGLYGYIKHAVLESSLGYPIEDASKRLMDAAYKAGGFDNISLIIIEGENDDTSN